MAGRGRRFEGYDNHKPLIEFGGKTLIEHAVTSLDLQGRYIFITQQQHNQQYGLDQQLKSIVPDCEIVEINIDTEGPACSALMAGDIINNDEPLVIANCDQIMCWDGAVFLHNAQLYDGTIVTYYETADKNSYARLDSRGHVTEIREKEPISTVSLNGIHYWQKGRYFVDSAEQMIANNERYNGEFYIGPTYNYMIKQGYTVGIHHIPNEQHNAVGIPRDLTDYINRVYANESSSTG